MSQWSLKATPTAFKHLNACHCCSNFVMGAIRWDTMSLKDPYKRQQYAPCIPKSYTSKKSVSPSIEFENDLVNFSCFKIFERLWCILKISQVAAEKCHLVLMRD